MTEPTNDPVAANAGATDGVPADGGPDLTEDEQVTLTTLPSLIGSAVAFSAKSGVVGMVKEMMANAKAAAEGRNTFPDNKLIGSILPKMDDAGAAIERAKSLQSAQLERLKGAGVESADDLRDYVLTQAAAARELLAGKVDGVEASQYKEWVMNVADSVANAAKEGGFLGIGGERVSESETETIDAIKTQLGD